MYVMHVCRYTCVQVHCVWVHVRDACVQVHVCAGACGYEYTCEYDVCVGVCGCMCVWVHVCTCMYAGVCVCAGAYGGQMTTCITPQELPILFLI